MRAPVSGLFLACAVSLCVMTSLGMTSVGMVAAARAADAPWSAPAACGQEPRPPVVDYTTAAHYNASVDAVTAYEKAARLYNGCVASAAGREEGAISAEARARMDRVHQGSLVVQQRIAGNFTRLSTELRDGAAHFAHKH
ncbi:conserved hypothetical protein [Gluconacetobacter diazotrophicus PA1 5]|uniref:Uncharacterized protein n=2 Tax=Gluconacetobacter diazotrophicus TaxID=33996 RepID=A0A7W4FD11_GLUDI|nr:hypothetical protein [Gluconacetobacter diazotrophicus]ACI52833.1 conserved hypothetical protein [Gluconacetobacter diazotrophicus PA1 5]MBB2155428.1 hypothetical protein [Gluconacetobacter diazotrophicus]TWB09022.1 hypothetical protein FBZ86_105128 [Gluconacetobacter diazotrophicus]CAP57205.1 putative exported protein [Gluconacetobacter diazotrophicus PA1 5]